jgi:hypothetical protein
MNWRRGLFRLWFVLSVFWFTAVAVIAFEDESLRRQQLAEQAACSDRRAADPNLGDPFGCFDAETKDVPWTTYGAWAVLPPLSALGLGAVARWVMRAFGIPRLPPAKFTTLGSPACG